MTSSKLLHVSAPKCFPWVFFLNSKGIQFQHANLGSASPLLD